MRQAGQRMDVVLPSAVRIRIAVRLLNRCRRVDVQVPPVPLGAPVIAPVRFRECESLSPERVGYAIYGLPGVAQDWCDSA